MKILGTAIAAIVATTALLTACTEKAPVEQVMKDQGSVSKKNAFSFQTVEEQRAQGRANAGASAAGAPVPRKPATP